MTNDTSIFQRVYDAEQNIRLSWFWDAGFEIAWGDKVNGIIDQATFQTFAEVEAWLEGKLIKETQ